MGRNHNLAQDRIVDLLKSCGYVCQKDYEYKTGSDRADTYFFDVWGEKLTLKGVINVDKHLGYPIFEGDIIVVEVDGNVGHGRKVQSTRNHANRKIKEDFCKEHNFRFFSFRTEDLIGKGYKSKKYQTKISVLEDDFIIEKEFAIVRS